MQTKNHLGPLSQTRSKHGVSLDERSDMAKFVTATYFYLDSKGLDAVSADGNQV